MNKSVVSFTKQSGQVTPYWLLQQMAGIDAVLIFKFAGEIASIKYDVPVAIEFALDTHYSVGTSEERP